MPAGFNNGQIEYIKSIANVNGHKTYKAISYPVTRPLSGAIGVNHLTGVHDTNLRYLCMTLGHIPKVYPAGAIGPTTDLIDAPDLYALNAFDIPATADENAAEYQRQGAEGFLESTHLRVRCLLDHEASGAFTAEHNEYRMIVFRHKERQHDVPNLSDNRSNWKYDLFHGLGGFKCGFSGFRHETDVSSDINYDNNSSPAGCCITWVDAQSVMTCPINTADYVVMKDHRFFLGASYGGKNIFETTLHWDWKDPIATTLNDVTTTESNKNYTWYILIMGNSNSTTSICTLNVDIKGLTHLTSG